MPLGAVDHGPAGRSRVTGPEGARVCVEEASEPPLARLVSGDSSFREAVALVSALQLPPDDPCVLFLKERGFDLGTDSGRERFVHGQSPLGGRRWYLPATICGSSIELLVDSGASHSVIDRKFYEKLMSGSEHFRTRFGTFVRIRFGGL